MKKLRDGRHTRESAPIDQLNFREAQQGDLPFLSDSFYQSAHSGFAWRNVPSATYERYFGPLLEAALRRSELHVVTPKDDEREIVGWMALERKGKLDEVCVHYCYTMHIFRGRKLQNMLLASFGVQPKTAVNFSHSNDFSQAMARDRSYQFNPFLFLQGY